MTSWLDAEAKFTPQIIPSPGTEEKTWEDVEKRLRILTPFAKTMHIDVVDGKFAPNVTFSDPKPFAKFTKEYFFEVHLMVEEPIAYLEAWAKAGFRRFIGQVERMSDQNAFVTKGQELGEVGLAIDGKTPLEAIKVPYIDLDVVLIMTINAGFSGQKLIAETLKKVAVLADTKEVPIEIDGGVNEETIQAAVTAGANRCVTTSAIFSAHDPLQAYHTLLAKMHR